VAGRRGVTILLSSPIGDRALFDGSLHSAERRD
jgi:hypothetical protein